MANTYKVKLGPVAKSFYDQDTGVLLNPGEVVELRANQFNNPRIKNAIYGGALELVKEDAKPREDAPKLVKYSPSDIEAALEKAKKMYDQGKNLDKIASKFDHDLILKMAENQKVEPEEGDTDVTILQAILEEDEEDPNGEGQE